MPNIKSDILNDVAAYYGSRIIEHGQTAAGVDWNSHDGQVTRFTQLFKLIDSDKQYSIADIGCGYGALLDYISDLGHTVNYIGIDVSQPMIEAARSRYASFRNAEFQQASSPGKVVNYSLASGIFNVRLNKSDNEWLPHLVNTLDMMNSVSETGFAFNCLTSYSDPDRMRPDLYYANPIELFDLCKRRFSRKVALYHDYDLYEFTLIVRK